MYIYMYIYVYIYTYIYISQEDSSFFRPFTSLLFTINFFFSTLSFLITKDKKMNDTFRVASCRGQTLQ